MLAEEAAVRKIGYDLLGRSPGCETIDHDVSVSGDEKSVRKLDQCGLSAPVRSQEPYDLSTPDR